MAFRPARSKARFARNGTKSGLVTREGRRETSSGLCGKKQRLALGELEPLTSALLTILLALVLARIPREKPQLLQPRTQLCVELHQRPRNRQTNCAGLSRHATARRKNYDIELVHHLRSGQRLAHHGARAFRGEIVFKGP